MADSINIVRLDFCGARSCSKNTFRKRKQILTPTSQAPPSVSTQFLNFFHFFLALNESNKRIALLSHSE
jgi:hypothetical protein